MNPSNIFRQLGILILSVVATVTLVPIIVVVAAILYVYRKLVLTIAKLIKPEFHSPLSIVGSYFAVDQIYGKPAATMCPTSYIRGCVSNEEFKKSCEKVVAKHPEFGCKLSRWMGVYFLEQCKDFDVAEQIRSHPCKSGKEYEILMDKMINDPWKQGKPLWDAVLLPNYKRSDLGTKSAAIVRFHHSVTDGFAMMAFFHALGDDDPVNDKAFYDLLSKLTEKYTPKFWQKVIINAYLVTIGPFVTVYRLLSCLESTMWTLSGLKKDWKMTHRHVFFNLERAKQISRRLKKNVTCLVQDIVIAALRRVMREKKGETALKDMNFSYPIPRPGHPGTITNHLIVDFISLPISEGDRGKRLKILERNLRKMMTGFDTLGMLAFNQIYGLITSVLGWEFDIKNLGSGTMSNALAPGAARRLYGHEMSHFSISVGTLNRAKSLMINSFTFNNSLEIGVTMDTALFPGENGSEKIIRIVKEEFDELEKYSLEFEAQESRKRK